MNKIIDRPLFWILLLCLLLLPFLILSFYSHPSADDYIIAAVIREKGIYEHFKQVYFEWSGRYFSTIISLFSPLVFGWIFGYKIIPFLLIILFYFSICFFFRSIFRESLTLIKTHLISLFIIILFFNKMPSTAEGIYWISSSLNYFLSIIFILFFFSIIIRVWNKTNVKNSSNIFLCLLPVIIIGSNEISMIFIDEILFTIIITQFILKRKIKPVILISAGCALIASLFEISTPGNFFKMDSFPVHSNLLLALKLSSISFLKIGGTYLKDPVFIIGSMLFISFLPTLYKNENIQKVIIFPPYITVPVSIIIIISLYFIVSFSTGMNPALRIHNEVGFIFIFMWFYNIIVLHNYFFKLNKIEMIEVPDLLIKLLSIGAIIIIVSDFNKEPGKEISPEGNIFRAGYDLIINAQTYNSELNKREALIQESVAKNIKYLEVPALTKIPTTIHFIDISDKTYDWINISTAEYFGLDSIKISTP
ncbi:MAG TPA: DUF6056 family protein [Bacteroidales bacterium]|nr:DUF6056 family protein [Bacteroidales bacterium]HPS17571.1 DUF6056 family protein [Bacteroidales bacterium]